MNAQNYRKPVAPPPYVSYAHKLGRGMLTFEQIDELVRPINPAYVETKQGLTYLAQHQARAEMNRIFGYGNWDSHVDELVPLYEEQRETGSGTSKKLRWVVGYRAKVTVNIRDLWGMPVATFSEWHAEENAPQPNRGEAHALALTSVESYALRRALIGLGDRFGLGLYDGGSTAAHGQYTIQQYPGLLYTIEQGQPAQQPPQPAQQQPQAQVEQPAAQQPQPEPQQAQQQPQQGGYTPSPQMEEFRRVQEEQQAARNASRGVSPDMQARLQQGLKVDGQEGQA